MIYNQPGQRARAPPPLDDYGSVSEYGHLAAGDPYAAASTRTAVPLPSPSHAQSQPSPPISQHHSGSTDNSLMSRPSTNRSISAANSHLSTASSLSHVSDGHNFYSPTNADFGRGPSSSVGMSKPGPGIEEVLHRHYNVLKGYLTPYLKDEAGNTRPTRARDKLLRLSPTQFHELSTDVYDEFLRREDHRMRPGGGVPPYLPPKQSFHPKRNQARQKLSTLPPDRFRQLATDVFYELERRIPRLGLENMDRPGSSAGSFISQTSRQGGPNGSMRGPPHRGPPPPGMRPGAGGNTQDSPVEMISPPPRFDSRSRSDSLSQPGANNVRPVAQTTQSSTIVPNKSTIVEDDETDDDSLGLMDRGSMGSTGSKEQRLREYEAQVSEMQERIHELEDRLLDIESKRPGDQERDEWAATKSDLESRLAASQQSLESLHEELELSHTDRNESESHLRADLSNLQLELDEVRRENESLRESVQQSQHSRDLSTSNANTHLAEELAAQRALTDEVRRNAQTFLQEMRMLSEQSDLAVEKEEELRRQIAALEQETEHWKTRYTKARTQVRTLRASSVGLGIQHDADHTLRNRHNSQTSNNTNNNNNNTNSLLRPNGSGLVPDLAVSAYQVSIDEFLHAARDPNDSELALHKAKSVIKAVRAIVADIDGDVNGGVLHSPGSSSSQVNTTVNGGDSTARGSSSMNGHPVALKARITRDANRLVTAARTHAMSCGVAPVSLLDAAASNLTASVVALLGAVGVRRSAGEEMAHEGVDGRVDYAEHERRGYTEKHEREDFTAHERGDHTDRGKDHHSDNGQDHRTDNGQDHHTDDDKSDYGRSEYGRSDYGAEDHQPTNESIQHPVLQPLTFGSPPPTTTARQQAPSFDTSNTVEDMHGFSFNHNNSGSSFGFGGLSHREEEKPVTATGTAAGAGRGGWFNMLKSPTLSHKGSMVESDGESEDERYGYA